MEIDPGRFYKISCKGSDGEITIIAKALLPYETLTDRVLWKCEGRQDPYKFLPFVASAEQFGEETLPPICETARAAIQVGVKRNDPVAHLEYLGLDHRNINALESSKYEIIHLAELVCYTREELGEIANFGQKSIVQLFDALSRYHFLDSIMEDYEHKIDDERKKWFPGHFEE